MPADGGSARGDRRLNVAIHEEVIGRGVRIGAGTGPEQEFTLPVIARDAESGERVPPYSADPDATRRVVDAMRERGWALEDPRPEGEEATQWAAGFHRGEESVVYTARTETAAKSVCRAALRAVRSRDAPADGSGTSARDNGPAAGGPGPGGGRP